MKQRSSPKLMDVARAAGVSLSTASRALAQPALVREVTREHVRNVASRLGYLPHGAARALATRRSKTIGAVFPPVDNPIFASATHSLAHELAAAGYTLLLATHEYDPQVELAATRALLERGVDGMVLVGLDHAPAAYQMLAQSGVPYDLMWSLDATGFHHCVGIAHRLASVRVVQHLLDLGHREFAVIAGVTAHNDRARERLASTREALAGRGIELRDHRVIESEFSVPRARRAFVELLARAPGFTALVCGNDLLALGALTESLRRGIRVPGDLSIAGFDDIDMASEITPSLTTVRVPAADIGRRAAARMLERLAGREVPAREEVPVELVVRESTGRAPA
ncbi:MAG TPA: substrate-binding domain-containing protein [Burkholderiales bacterium]|nr:substrate-binding domain-containing protein [Burkholderiales bacterium]